MRREKILVTGACGQIGTELVSALREKYGNAHIIASDRFLVTDELIRNGLYIKVDVMNPVMLERVVNHGGVTQIYHLAAVLSANGEKDPRKAWDLNMQSLLNVLEAARKRKNCRVFWPSSIAVFGKQSFKAFCSQHSVTDPSTVYGISKCAGEYWCQYYFEKYGLDVRSLRYPGLISYQTKPGGVTTDYAVEIFYEAIRSGSYQCFLKENTTLPMMYMPDAIRATLQLMEAPLENIRIRTAYNLSGFSFSPKQLAEEIRVHLPDFQVSYFPDFRQLIADSWPSSIDDHHARKDWGWCEAYNLKTMTEEMVNKILLPVL